MSRDKIELYRGRDGQFYFRLVAGNGQVFFPSEGYTRKWSARRAVRRFTRTLRDPVKVVDLT